MHNREKDFEQAYHEFADQLFRYSFFKVGDRDVATDVVQECFTKTWSYIVGGGEVVSLKSFLYHTLRNLIIDTYREKKHASLDSMADQGFDPAGDTPEALMEKLDGERALALLSRLPEEYSDVIFLRFVDGLSFGEIAELTGESANTLTVRSHRGIQKLKELFTTSHHE